MRWILLLAVLLFTVFADAGADCSTNCYGNCCTQYCCVSGYDGYTAIPWKKKPAEECPDGPRYKALGNSMAVPVMRWIGERICRFHA